MDMKHYEDNSIHPFIEKTCFNPSHPPCSIHSVKRLSDGVVFTKMEMDGNGLLITGFKVIGNEMEVELDYGSQKKRLSNLTPPTPTEQTKSDVLFTTPCISLNDIYHELKMICDGTFGDIDRWNFVLSSTDTPEYFYKRFEEKAKQKLNT